MRKSKRLITLAAMAALALGISAPAQAESVYSITFAGKVTLSGPICYPTVCPATKSTKAMTGLSTLACQAVYAGTKTPATNAGACSVSLVSGTVGTSGITGQGPWCGNSGGGLTVDVTLGSKTVRAALSYESFGSALVLVGSTSKGNEMGTAAGAAVAVPDATTGESCTTGADVFLVAANIEAVGLGAK